jgi:hypothetical protein
MTNTAQLDIAIVLRWPMAKRSWESFRQINSYVRGTWAILLISVSFMDLHMILGFV